MERKPITPRGKDLLEVELKDLKEVKRPAVINEVASAREKGDLKENAEYHAAREAQGLTEARITEIESILATSDVINSKDFKGDTQVKFGAKVSLEDEDGLKKEYTIVGIPESDVSKGFIPFNSPVARALIGKNIGEEVEVRTPGGEKIFVINGVEYV